jgi:SAM-dependent methyltransferase
MPEPDVQQQMRADWDRRAREDACYYVAFGRRRQTAEEFFASAADVLRAVDDELRRWPPSTDPKTLSALEIGCGPGRLLVPLSRVFGQVTGVDVSQEMVELARANLRDIPNARAEAVSGSDLAAFPDESFDFCYSYAVFQHIPSRDVIFSYLREARRVLRTGALLKLHFNGMPEEQNRAADTWSGVRFRQQELRDFCREHDLQLLSLEGAGTPSLWIAARKRAAGWGRSVQPSAGARILRITNALTEDQVVPAAGRFSCASLAVEGLHEDADLNNLEVEIAGLRVAPSYLGHYVWNGPAQVNVFLPPGVPTGLLMARLWMLGQPVSAAAPLRVIPPPPAAPRLRDVTDGINLMARARTETRTLKIDVEEAGPRPVFAIDLDGVPLEAGDVFRVDPLTERYTINLAVPPEVPAGRHRLTVRLHGRPFAPVELEIAG